MKFPANPYLLGFIASLVFYVLLLLARRFFRFYKSKILNGDSYYIEITLHGVSSTTQLFMLTTALYIGFQLLPEYEIYPTWSWRIFFSILMLQIIIWGNAMIRKWMELSFSRRRRRDPASASSLNILELMLKVSFIFLALIFTLHNLGIKVTTMLAGLGISGIAVALALQNILGDIFSSLSIILDKPFVVGDFIVLGEWMGEVERIGLKTTRLRSLTGEQIIMSNSDLLGSRIRNMKRMHERRVSLIFSLPQDAGDIKIKNAVEIISSVIQSKQNVRFERCHFMKITHNSLDIESVYWVLSDDYNLHMDIQQSLLLDLVKIFQKEGLQFAYPIQKQIVSTIQ